MNRGINKNNKIGIKGVSKRNDRKGYAAQLYFEGRTVLCNYFSTIEEATKARVEAEEKYFGEFRYQE